MSRATIEAELALVERTEVLVDTNQGTYGADEALRCVGSGDPAHADRLVYETAGGARRATGPTAEDAPGHMRQIGRSRLADLRRQAARLRAQLRTGQAVRS